MKIGLMQPYFFPYIGYWQLINAVDKFVVYDNIQYTKKGWINRNNYLLNDKKAVFSINIKNDSDYMNVNERYISPEYKRERIVSMFQNAYYKAPMKETVLPLIDEIIRFPADNLFDYIYNSLIKTCDYLNIKTDILVSSGINIDHSLRSEQKVIAVCKELQGDIYINSIGGMALYSKANFANENIGLKFIKSKPIEYKQFNNEFAAWLSIIDVMLFNSKEQIKQMLDEYDLLEES